MPFYDRERPIDLLEQNHSRQFVGQRHSAQRKLLRGRLPHFLAEPVCWSNRKQQRQRIAISVVSQPFGEFLGRKLLSARIQQNQRVPWPRIGRAQLQQSCFIFKSEAFDGGIAAEPFQVFVGQRLNGRLFGFSDPGNLQFHGKDLNTGDTEEHR